jgi:DNA-binding NarL/FixJ family response regulator
MGRARPSRAPRRGGDRPPARPQHARPAHPQELQVVAAVGEGVSNREVAARLFITPRTVAHHLHQVFGKLGISSRAELVRIAHDGGVLRP